MKEYLEKQANGSYNLVMRGIVGKDDDIEVPEGAESFNYFGNESNVFFLKNNSEITLYSNETEDSAWQDWGDFDLDGVVCLWSRHTQPEELPFIDDEPSQSLNDQYAEIEQVRQSGMKFDGNKPRYSLLPKGVVNSVVEVLEFGAKKYSADNWQEVDNAEERYYNAAMRHIDLWWNGEKRDPETGIHHLAHAATNLFFLMWFDNK